MLQHHTGVPHFNNDCLSPGPASVIPIFGIGLYSGAAGGLLLGATAVVMIQALELPLRDKPLMEQLEKYVLGSYYFAINIEVHDLQVSVFAGVFGVFSSTLSLTVGFYLALSTYSLVIRYEGEGARTKALRVAGSVCLMGVTATGLLLGFTFQAFLSLTLSTNVVLWVIISFAGYCMFPLPIYCQNTYLCILLSGIVYTPTSSLLVYIFTFWFNMRSSVAAVLFPVIIYLKILENSYFFKTTAAPVPIMLVISDVFNIMGQRIVSLQSPISSTLSEAIFIGVFAALLWAVTVGISLFAFCQRDECISAAGAWTMKYAPAASCHGFFGRAGVTMGVAVGAFLSCCAHGGLSKMFLVLCTSMIPAALFLKLLILEIPLQRLNWHLFVCFLILVVLLPFT